MGEPLAVFAVLLIEVNTVFHDIKHLALIEDPGKFPGKLGMAPELAA